MQLLYVLNIIVKKCPQNNKILSAIFYYHKHAT